MLTQVILADFGEHIVGWLLRTQSREQYYSKGLLLGTNLYIPRMTDPYQFIKLGTG